MILYGVRIYIADPHHPIFPHLHRIRGIVLIYIIILKEDSSRRKKVKLMHVHLRPPATSISAPAESPYRIPHSPRSRTLLQASSSRSSLLQSRNICSLIVHVSDGVSSFICSFPDRPTDRLSLGGWWWTLRAHSSQSSFSPAFATCTPHHHSMTTLPGWVVSHCGWHQAGAHCITITITNPTGNRRQAFSATEEGGWEGAVVYSLYVYGHRMDFLTLCLHEA